MIPFWHGVTIQLFAVGIILHSLWLPCALWRGEKWIVCKLLLGGGVAFIIAAGVTLLHMVFTGVEY